MKLQLVPASAGPRWVRQGIQTFFKQPLAFCGLFFMFMAVMSVLSLVPVLGNVLALMLLPGATLGLMAATQEAATGKRPVPALLISAFRAGRAQLQSMLLLGGLYAAGFLLVLGISALADGGKFAHMYLVGGTLSAEVLQAGDFQLAALIAMVLYLPLSLLFWHAPALVHWHGIAPVKSLFFSLVACLRNFWAFTLYGMVWMVVFVGLGILVATVAALAGGAETVGAVMFPMAMLTAAMFFASIYFTFRDSFEASV